MRKGSFPMFSLSLVVFLACASYAQIPESNATAISRLTEEQQIINQLTPLLNEFQVIQNDDAQVAKRWGDLKRSGAQIKKQAKEHNADSAEFIQATADHETRRKAHDEHCAGVSGDASLVSMCNAETRANDDEAKRLVAWGKRLNDEQALLKKAVAGHIEQAEAIRAKHEENNARTDKVRAALQPLLDRLRTIQMDACNDATRNSSDGTARDTCNQMLDGSQQ